MAAAPGSARATSVDLVPNANVRIEGAAGGDASGTSVAGAGDVNGDGRDDVIVGAPQSGGSPGSSYVLYGPVNLARLDLLTLTPSQGFRIDAATAGDQSGVSVAAAGDLNGDGRDDVILGAPGAGNNGRGGSGSSYVIYGSASSATISLGSLGTKGFRIDGAAGGDGSGRSVDGAGDVNGDGYDDVILGAPGAGNNGRSASGSSYVVYGSAGGGGDVDLASLAARGFRIDGAAMDDASGKAVAGAGDVNGDGRDEVIVGAPDADNNGGGSGSSYVVFGSASPVNLDLAGLTVAQGFRIDGVDGSDSSGFSVAGAGDQNGDGRDDVVVGAPTANVTGRGVAGVAYVVYGSAGSPTVDLGSPSAAQGFRIFGAESNIDTGVSVAAAGDVNGDGRDDVIVGAHGTHFHGANSGSSYVVYGSQAPGDVDLLSLASAQGFRMDGAAMLDLSGSSVAGAGDLNGDGRDDVLVGAPLADDNGRTGSGSSYIVYSTFLPAIAYDPTILGKVGQALSVDPSRFRATGPRSVSVSPALPAGLSIDPATGRISGTPTATGIGSHRVTLTDDTGTTATTVQVAIVDPQGGAGPAGPGGGAGPSGPNGAPGPQGSPGQTGATGATGSTGKTGSTGARGPRGTPGRDAKVRCVSGRIKGHKVTVRCKLTFAKVSGLRSARATLSRGATVYARGSRGSAGPVTLRAARRVKAGSYTLRLSVTTRAGTTVTKKTVRIARP
jgi:hypothetical protein